MYGNPAYESAIPRAGEVYADRATEVDNTL